MLRRWNQERGANDASLVNGHVALAPRDALSRDGDTLVDCLVAKAHRSQLRVSPVQQPRELLERVLVTQRANLHAQQCRSDATIARAPLLQRQGRYSMMGGQPMGPPPPAPAASGSGSGSPGRHGF